MMKDLLWAESQKLHRSKILWIAGFATVMVGLIVFAQGQFTFYDRRYIDGAGWFMQARRVHARYMLGMKVKDIAAMEGITPSQAGKSIHAALRRLRRYFARQKWTVNL